MPYKPTGGRPGRKPGFSPGRKKIIEREEVQEPVFIEDAALPVPQTPKTKMKSNARLPRSTRRERYEEMSPRWRDTINWHWDDPEPE